MAEAADKEQVMPTRTEAWRMSKAATDYLGPDIERLLDRIPQKERFNTLLMLACSLACMATAEHRKDFGNDRVEEFYECVRIGTLAVLLDLLPPLRGEDYEVSFADGVEGELDADPKKAAAVKSVLADIRQALDGVATGKFASQEEALASLGGTFINLDDLPEELQAQIRNDDDKGTLQ